MHRTLLILSLAALVGCKTPSGHGGTSITTEQANEKATPVAASTLGSGDVVEIRVFQEADLSGAFRISPEGTLDYPLCGRLTMGNRTSSMVADLVTECLRKG